MMGPPTRKLALTAHVSLSVGWIGAVAGFLALSIAGLTSDDPAVVRSSYLGMDTIGRFVIVPLSFVALATGLVQALGTQWGLVQHYWVLAKLFLTLTATIALLLHQFTAVTEAAKRASLDVLPSAELSSIGSQLVADATLAIALLVAVTTLSIYKPWGRTRYGLQAQQRELRNEPTTAGASVGLRIAMTIIGAIAVGFVVLHLAGGGLGRHGF
jgi:hypothetical protein